MGGSESKFVTKMLDDPALKAKFYKEMRFDTVADKIKAAVEHNLRHADAIVNKKKEEYGLGVSVKGVVVNLNKTYALVLEDGLVNIQGKDWTDPEVLPPKPIVGSTDSSPFFHAKRDTAMCGSAGAFQYAVTESLNEDPIAYLGVAWYNPYNDKFRSRIVLSDVRINIEKLCQQAIDGPPGKHEDVEGKYKNYPPEAKKSVLTMIETFLDETDHSTSYFVVAIQGDHNLPKAP